MPERGGPFCRRPVGHDTKAVCFTVCPHAVVFDSEITDSCRAVCAKPFERCLSILSVSGSEVATPVRSRAAAGTPNVRTTSAAGSTAFLIRAQLPAPLGNPGIAWSQFRIVRCWWFVTVWFSSDPRRVTAGHAAQRVLLQPAAQLRPNALAVTKHSCREWSVHDESSRPIQARRASA